LCYLLLPNNFYVELDPQALASLEPMY
jgi:hypothetical protein